MAAAASVASVSGRSDEAAEHAAQSDHDLALRSQLNFAVQEDSHEEYSFEGIPATPR